MAEKRTYASIVSSNTRKQWLGYLHQNTISEARRECLLTEINRVEAKILYYGSLRLGSVLSAKCSRVMLFLCRTNTIMKRLQGVVKFKINIGTSWHHVSVIFVQMKDIFLKKICLIHNGNLSSVIRPPILLNRYKSKYIKGGQSDKILDLWSRDLWSPSVDVSREKVSNINQPKFTFICCS